jgi:hypothetical protein
MQAEDRAEFEGERVRDVFNRVLGDEKRASNLLEHIRYRTGLLLERRPNIFGFAHLTFQEYLAARAIHEGNRLGVDANQLVREHDDGRWKEVIALYSGLATTPAARDLIEQLIKQDDTRSLGEVLTEAYFSAGADLAQDQGLRKRVIERVAVAPGTYSLTRFSLGEVTTIANALVGTIKSCISTSASYVWLMRNSTQIDMISLEKRIKNWQKMTPNQVLELIYLFHRFAPDEMLEEIAKIPCLYSSIGPSFENESESESAYSSQAEIAIMALLARDSVGSSIKGFNTTFRKVIQSLISVKKIQKIALVEIEHCIERNWVGKENKFFTLACNYNEKQEFLSLLRQLANCLINLEIVGNEDIPFFVETSINSVVITLNQWVDVLEGKEEFSKPISTKKRAKSKKR